MMRIAIVLSLLFVTTWGAQADWPQYLGPDRNARASEADLARAWPEGGPKQLWTVKMGPGFGGASVHGDEVFVLDRIAKKADVLRCLDLATGEEKWRFEYDAPGKLSYPGSRTVPTVDDEYIWSMGAFGHLHCISRKTHEVVWKTNILEQFDAELPGWGVAQAPLIYKDLVIVAPQGERAGVVAFDKKTGEVRWMSRKLTGRPCHVSPALANFGGVPQVVMISPYDEEKEAYQHEVLGINVANGEVLWTYDGLRSFATIAPPTIVDENRLFLTDGSYDGGYNPVSVMINVQRSGDSFSTVEIFKNVKDGSKLHPPVLHDGYLYLNSGGRGEYMQCMTLEGETLWTGAPPFSLGALISVGDLIINQNGKNGDVFLIDPSPEGYKELARAELFSARGKTPWAPLTFSDGKLIVRDNTKMICLDLKNPG